MAEILTYAFEGLDGAGKTTNINLLKAHFEERGINLAAVSSPSRSGIGQILRKNIARIEPERVDKLFLYDIKRTTRSIPESVEVVLWDRHIDSLYTSNRESNLEDINAKAVGIPRPDTVFILDIPAELAWEREKIVSDHPIYYQWLVQKQARYQELLNREPDRFHLINATLPLEAVFSELVSIVSEDLSRIGRLKI